MDFLSKIHPQNPIFEYKNLNEYREDLKILFSGKPLMVTDSGRIELVGFFRKIYEMIKGIFGIDRTKEERLIYQTMKVVHLGAEKGWVSVSDAELIAKRFGIIPANKNKMERYREFRELINAMNASSLNQNHEIIPLDTYVVKSYNRLRPSLSPIGAIVRIWNLICPCVATPIYLPRVALPKPKPLINRVVPVSADGPTIIPPVDLGIKPQPPKLDGIKNQTKKINWKSSLIKVGMVAGAVLASIAIGAAAYSYFSHPIQPIIVGTYPLPNPIQPTNPIQPINPPAQTLPDSNPTPPNGTHFPSVIPVSENNATLINSTIVDSKIINDIQELNNSRNGTIDETPIKPFEIELPKPPAPPFDKPTMPIAQEEVPSSLPAQTHLSHAFSYITPIRASIAVIGGCMLGMFWQWRQLHAKDNKILQLTQTAKKKAKALNKITLLADEVKIQINEKDAELKQKLKEFELQRQKLLEDSQLTISDLENQLENLKRQYEDDLQKAQKDLQNKEENLRSELKSSEYKLNEEKQQLTQNYEKSRLELEAKIADLEKQQIDGNEKILLFNERLLQSQRELEDARTKAQTSAQNCSLEIETLKKEIGQKSREIEVLNGFLLEKEELLRKSEEDKQTLLAQEAQYQKEIEALKNQVNEKQIGIEKWQQVVEAKEKELLLCKEKEASLTQSIEDQKSEIAGLKKDLAQLTDEKNDLIVQLSTKENEFETKEKAFQGLTEQLQQLNNIYDQEVKNNTEKLKNAEILINSLQGEIDALNIELVKDTSKLIELEEKYQSFDSSSKQEKEQILAEKSICQTQIQDLQNHLEQKNKELVQHQALINVLKLTLDFGNRKRFYAVEGKQRIIEKLLAKLKGYEDEIDNLTHDLADLNQQNEALTTQIKNFEQAIKDGKVNITPEMWAEIQESYRAAEATKEERVTLTKRLAEITEEAAQLKNKLAEFESENARLVTETNQDKKENDEKDVLIKTLTDKLNGLEKIREEIRKTEQIIQQNRNEIKKHLDSILEKEREKLRNEHEKLSLEAQKSHSSNESDIKDLENRIFNLNESINESNQLIEGLKKTSKLKEKENKKLEKKLQELEAKQSEIEQSSAEDIYQVKLSILKVKMDALEERNNELEELNRKLTKDPKNQELIDESIRKREDQLKNEIDLLIIQVEALKSQCEDYERRLAVHDQSHLSEDEGTSESRNVINPSTITILGSQSSSSFNEPNPTPPGTPRARSSSFSDQAREEYWISQINCLRAEKEILVREMQESEETLERLKSSFARENAKFEAKIRVSEKAMQQLKEQHNKEIATLQSSFKEEKSKLEITIEIERTTVERLKKQHNEERNRLNNEIEQLKKEKSQLWEEKNSLELQMEGCKKIQKSQSDIIADREKLYIDAHNLNLEYIEEIKLLKIQIESLGAQLFDKEEEVKKKLWIKFDNYSQAQVNNFATQEKTLNNIINRQTAEIAKLRTRIEDWKKANPETNAEIIAKNTRIKELTQKLNAANKLREELTLENKQIEELNKRIEKLEERLKENPNYKIKWEKALDELGELKKVLEELEKSKSASEKKLERTETSNVALQREIEALKKQIQPSKRLPRNSQTTKPKIQRT